MHYSYLTVISSEKVLLIRNYIQVRTDMSYFSYQCQPLILQRKLNILWSEQSEWKLEPVWGLLVSLPADSVTLIFIYTGNSGCYAPFFLDPAESFGSPSGAQ